MHLLTSRYGDRGKGIIFLLRNPKKGGWVAKVRARLFGANLRTNQAAERRKIAAHGASRGLAKRRRFSPGGAQEAAFGWR
jgi:hypothetical protein